MLVVFYPTLSDMSRYRSIKCYNVGNTYTERVICVKPLKEKVSITLDSDIVERIKQLAEEDERSFSQYINKVLKDYLKNNDKK